MEPQTKTPTEAFERAAFLAQLTELLAGWGAGDEKQLRGYLEEGLADVDDAALVILTERMRSTGGSWGYHAADPVGRRLSRLTLERVLRPGSDLDGLESLRCAQERPVVFLGNHLSFIDANVMDDLIARAGHDEVAARLAVMVGPKVFAVPIRRLASLCFGTIKIPQSTARASGEAVMSSRDVARLARQTLTTVAERQSRGEHLLVFPEGSRSRGGGMQRCLAAVARYLEHDGALIVPFGLWGSEKLVPLDRDHVYPTVVRARLGTPVEAASLLERPKTSRQLIGDVIGYLIADLLPAEYRGVYAQVPAELEPARRVANSVSD